MNCKEILQTYGPVYEYMTDKQLFEKMADLCYRQIGHGVSFEYWKAAYGSNGRINASNIRVHINNAINETGTYSDVVMTVGLARYRKRKLTETV